MTADGRDGDGNFLRRWSQRKLAAAREAGASGASAPPAPAHPAAAVPSSAATVADSRPAGAPVAAGATATAPVHEDAPSLPPVDSLTFDSDFTAFLSPKVDETMKRQALRRLFGDPRFNVMDGLDVYIDDYSKFEPIPEDLLGKLAHARYIFDPPKTRVNEAGYVEDVPDEPPQAVAGADARAEGNAGAAADVGAGVDADPAAGTGADAQVASVASGRRNEAQDAATDQAHPQGGTPLPEPALPPAARDVARGEDRR